MVFSVEDSSGRYGWSFGCECKVTYTSSCSVVIESLVSCPAGTDWGSCKCPYSLSMSEEDRERMSCIDWTKLFLPTGENEHMTMNNPSTQIYQVKTERLFWTVPCVTVMTVLYVQFLVLTNASMCIIIFLHLTSSLYLDRQGREHHSHCTFTKTDYYRTT